MSHRHLLHQVAVTAATLAGAVAAAAVLALAPGLAVAAACPAQAPPSAGMPYTQVMALVLDDTQERTARFRQEAVDLLGPLLRQPGIRIVVSRFGGQRSLPSIVADFVTPAAPPPQRQDLQWIARVATRPSGADEAERACAATRTDAARAAFLGTLKAAMAVYDGADDGASPVILAVDQAVAPFVQVQPELPVSVLVISDALEHTKGLSLYPVNGQYPAPAEVIAKAASLYRGSWRGVRISFAGLGLTRTADPLAVGALTDIWRALIAARGGTLGELSTSVPLRLAEREVPSTALR